MRFSAAVLFAASLLIPSAALAQPKDGGGAPKQDCPPGSWFCDNASGGDAAKPDGAKPAAGGGAEKNGALAPLPAEEEEAPKKADSAAPIAGEQKTPPAADSGTGARQPPSRYVYVPRKARPKSEIGMNLHLGGMPIAASGNRTGGMTLLGAGLRFRPIPELALQGDFDIAAGRDGLGRRRGEAGLSVNGMLFVNPKSKVQLYFVGGMGWQAASVRNTFNSGPTYTHYSYLGVQGGTGVEFRLSKIVALDFDVRGLVRTRVDSHADSDYEFRSSTGRRTNTSGGALFTGGITFYF